MINYEFFLLLAVCCGYALWKGGAPERQIALLYLAAVALTEIASGAQRWTSFEIGIFTGDILALFAFVYVTLRAERFWPIWFTAIHVISLAGHGVKMADPNLIPWGYAIAVAKWSYPLLFLIAAGTWCHRRRLARYGADPDWSREVGAGRIASA